MFDMGSGGPTRYLAHAVEWNSRRRAVVRSTVVVARDIPGFESVDHGLTGSPLISAPASGSGGATKKLNIVWSKFYDSESNSKLMMVYLSLDFWFECGHASDDPRSKQETNQRPPPTGGSGMGPGHLLALEVDRWNLDGSRET